MNNVPLLVSQKYSLMPVSGSGGGLALPCYRQAGTLGAVVAHG